MTHPLSILITGSAGFIGYHAAIALHKKGHFVIGCDHFNAYYDPSLKKARTALLKNEGIETLHADIGDSIAIEKIIKDHQITHVLHLAAQAGVRYSLDHAEDYVQSNLVGFVHLLEVLKKTPHIKFIYASSSSVYGSNTNLPFSEKDQTDQPVSFYGATKKCNEVIATAYHHLFGIPCTALRFFTVYGPWGRPDMAYFSFTRAILEEKPISIYGEGKLERDFTYIDDIVTGIVAAIDLGSPLDIFNLGNSKPETTLNLVNILESLLEKKAILTFHPMPAGDVRATYADITKSQQKLKFNPSTHLKDGLYQFTKWYRSYYI